MQKLKPKGEKIPSAKSCMKQCLKDEKCRVLVTDAQEEAVACDLYKLAAGDKPLTLAGSSITNTWRLLGNKEGK